MHRSFLRRRCQRAFTLLELLVVMVIIGLLAGFVAPKYFGQIGKSEVKVARAQILGQIGRYGWTLWGAIQHASSPIEFDFWGWAMERFEAAAAVLTSPAWGRLLDEAAGDE